MIGQSQSGVGGYEQSFLSRRKEDVRNSQELIQVRKQINSSRSTRSLSPFQSYSNESFEVSAQQPVTLEREFKDEKNAIETSRSRSRNQSTVMSSREWSKIVDYKSKAPGINNSRVTLCSCLQLLPAPFDNSGLKLSLVGNNISEIDKVPGTLLQKVQTLYLSNNSISSLNGIEQFTNLRSLSVTNNLIRYLSHLRALTLNEQLERVSLEGNIVTGMPFYRQYVIGLCPHLVMLDGVNVTVEERASARSSSRQLSAFYDQLRLNELQNIVLQNICLHLNLHADFNRTVLGRFRSLRSESVPSSRDISLSSEVGRGRGVGFLLGQCLSGGVFRWLMLACGQDIDKAIQNIAYRSHLSLIAKMGGKDRAHVLRDPKANALHWESTVGECLKHQQQMRLQLLTNCMVERADSNSADTKANDGEIINVLQQLEFEASALHAASQQAKGGQGVRESGDDSTQWVREYRQTYCGIGSSASHSVSHIACTPSRHGSGSRVSFENEPRERDDRREERRENVVGVISSKGTGGRESPTRDRNPPPPPSTSFIRSSTPSDTSRTPPDEVQAKYLSLLRQMGTASNLRVRFIRIVLIELTS
jgi:hypothetical protein